MNIQSVRFAVPSVRRRRMPKAKIAEGMCTNPVWQSDTGNVWNGRKSCCRIGSRHGISGRKIWLGRNISSKMPAFCLFRRPPFP